MAFPTVEGTSSGNGTPSSSITTVTLPSSIAANDLILIFVTNSGGQSVENAPSGYTLIDVHQSGDQTCIAAYYKIAAGGETSTTIDWFGTPDGDAYICYRITGYNSTTPVAFISTQESNGAQTTPDPASLSPSWGSADNLWLALINCGADGGTPTAPSGYSNLLFQTGTGTPDCFIASSQKTATASSENPGAYSANSSVYQEMTVAIQPAAAAFSPKMMMF